MTQKELLYVEDAIEHENTIISICQKIVDSLNDNKLSLFISEQINEHQSIKEELLNVLKENVNE